MEISTESVKELRDKTGISIMQCRKALEEAGGDVEKAIIILRKRGGAVAEKKSDRTLGSGTIGSYVHNREIGAMVVLSCETDFVAKNKEFIELASQIAQQVAATNPEYLRREDIPAAARKTATDVFSGELKGKPAEMHEKILAGKLDSYFKDRVLMEQDYIRDPNLTIRNLIEAAVQKFGERIEVSQMVRFSTR